MSFTARGEPWFDDGNIILVAEDSTTAFRIHRGVLARHSEVFKSMFEIPQPLDTADSQEVCQTIMMHDLPGELSNLLKALYDGTTFANSSLEDFFYLAGILRLSTKYFIQHLRVQAIAFLAKTWSYTLTGHDQMVQTAISAPVVNELTYPYVHPIYVLHLARETHVRIVVPSALYFLSIYPLADLLKGDHPKLRTSHPSRPASTLGQSELRDYSLIYQWRIEVILEFIRRICGQRASSPGCTASKACSREFTRLSGRLARSWSTRTGPLHYMIQTINEISESRLLCATCEAAFRKDVLAFREEKWESLPAVLGLPSWLEMIDSDFSAT